MSNELQNHLELPYSELEELNLRAKEQRLEARSRGANPRRAPQVPERGETD